MSNTRKSPISRAAIYIPEPESAFPWIWVLDLLGGVLVIAAILASIFIAAALSLNKTDDAQLSQPVLTINHTTNGERP